MNFDLRTAGWIPVLTPDGSVQEVGIRNALVKAHEFVEVRCESPLATVAILRLLLTVLYRACGPRNQRGWAALWEAKELPAERIDAYLDSERCRDRFDLFSESRPFLQIGGLTMNSAAPIAVLATEAATGNNPTLFSHASDGDPSPTSPAEAARMLLAAQAFALGFGKAADAVVNGSAIPRPYLADAICLRGVTLFLSGKNLFETLILNLIPYLPESDEKAQAAWEQADQMADVDKVVQGKRKSEPARSPIDRYAWPSRMARLIPDADGRVRQVYFTQGREADKNTGDPMKVFVQSKTEGIYALNLNAGKAAWRDLHTFLRFDSHLEWPIARQTARHVGNGAIPTGAAYQVQAVGLATDPGKAGKFLLWRHDRMSVPASVLADANAIETIGTAIGDVEFSAFEIGGRLRRVVAGYLPPDGNPDPEDVKKLAAAIDTRPDFWARLEEHFARFLLELPQDRHAALKRWRAGVEQEAECALREACARLGHSARAMKATAAVSFKFNANQAEVERQRAEAKKRKRGKK